jgi:signal transduction histidine kinase
MPGEPAGRNARHPHGHGESSVTAFTQRPAYDLPLRSGESRTTGESEETATSLQAPLLAGNVRWFVRLRWVAIAGLTLLGCAALVAHRGFTSLGLRPPAVWPFLTAGLLLLANLFYLAYARRIVRTPPGRGAAWNLWTQIVIDLLSLTVVVHFLGSLETPTAFLYLAHIVLACIFFSRRQSLAVVGIASGLYALCIGLEWTQQLATPGIYLDPLLRRTVTDHPTFAWLSLLAVVGVFFVVWFLASHLSGLVRQRELELASANRRLTIAQRDKTRHMLRTTHELKAPFAAIAANAQLLLRGNCGPLSPEALDVVRRIAARCRRLAVEIQEMLQLANLQSADEQPQPVRLDLADVARWAIARVGAVAQERRVGIEEQLAPVPVVAVEDHLKMLATNIVGNAVVYSNEGGTVRVGWHVAPPDGPVLTVEDEGIGIPAEKLPRIFDDYYRTEEAVKHNKDSTGLGLAIVRHVADSHGIRVRVESEPGRGTRFTLRFPTVG